MQVEIRKVKIGERQRKDFGDIETLAASISRFGLLHPIIVDKELNLIAGHRRLLATMQLGWSLVEANLRDDLDEIARREIELEENIRRKDLNWPEEVRAVRDLFNLRRAKYGNVGGPLGAMQEQLGVGPGEDAFYGLTQAAEEMDRSKSIIHYNIQLANALDEFPELEEEQTKAAAWRRYANKKEIKLREEQARRTRTSGDTSDFQAEAERGDAQPDAEARPGDPGTTRQKIVKATWKGHGILYWGDSRDVLRYLPSKSVDAIVTDPPFALGMFKEGQQTSGTRLAANAGDMYDDDPHAIMDMLDETFQHAERVLKDDGTVYCFFHMTRYEPMFLMLRKHFGLCDPVPIIWIKNTPGIGDPNRSWVYAYEPILFVNRGGRSLVKPQAFNYLKYDTVPPRRSSNPDSKVHPTEKPAALLRHLILASCVKGEVVLDPFAGSASTLVAAHQAGCRFYGIEKHEGFYRAGVERIAEAVAAPQAAGQEENTYEAAANIREEVGK